MGPFHISNETTAVQLPGTISRIRGPILLFAAKLLERVGLISTESNGSSESDDGALESAKTRASWLNSSTCVILSERRKSRKPAANRSGLRILSAVGIHLYVLPDVGLM